MIVPDVNVLVYAFRTESPDHSDYRRWLKRRVDSREPLGLSELVLSSVVRILTHPRIFNPPTPLERTLDYVEALREQPNAVLLQPGPRHWQIFAELCRADNARGNLVPDAYHAALAIEHGAEWVTTHGDYARFNGLRTRHPLA